MRVLSTALLLFSIFPAASWAKTACPPSPFESSSPPGVSLVGHSGAPDPAGSVTYVIRDLARNPVPGSLVYLDFSACPELRLATDAVAPGFFLNCASNSIYGVTNMSGEVTFRIVGSRLSAVQPEPCLRAHADGMPLPAPKVSVFDLDGVNGVNSLDLTILAADLFSGQYRQRSDHDFDGDVDPMDLCVFARVLFGGGSVSSGVACQP